MSKEKQIINKTLEKKYEYGFTTDIEQETIPPGLDEDVIKLISQIPHLFYTLCIFKLKKLCHL